ncbi:MAG: TIGR01777 family oxidoreductase [Vicinamibacterales bacterium]
MKIVIAGGTGFLGVALAETYAEEGHDVRVLTRQLKPGESRHDPGTGVPGVTRVGWRPDGRAGAAIEVVNGADAVVNLAGANLGDARWTPQRKAVLHDSRILPTRSIAAAITESSVRPPVFISASGVGYYRTGSESMTESSPAGNDFLAELCQEWEREALRAQSAATRVVPIRSGVVLERSGGVLPKMMTPFRFFVGGPLGSGRQYLSWIHRIDWIELIRWIAGTPSIAGPVNATAPVPVTNRDFARALGRAMRRPSFIPAPAFALRLALGEMADPLTLTGHRVIPQVALSHGFHFRYPEIDLAFRGIFGE